MGTPRGARRRVSERDVQVGMDGVEIEERASCDGQRWDRAGAQRGRDGGRVGGMAVGTGTSPRRRGRSLCGGAGGRGG